MFKKITTAIVTTAIAVTSLCSVMSISSNAAVTKEKTFRLYVDTKAGYNIRELFYVFNYSNNVTFAGCKDTEEFNGTLYYADSPSTRQLQFFYYTNSTGFNSVGTAATITFYTPLSTTDILSQLSISSDHKKMGGESIPTSVSLTPILVGDVTQDGINDIRDTSLVSQYLAGKEKLSVSQYRAADVNGDGIVNNADLSMLAQFDLQTIGRF